MNNAQPAGWPDVDKLIAQMETLNSRAAAQEVRIALLENAMANLLFSAHPQGVPELTNALELVKLDWIEQGSPNTTEDLISVLRRGPRATGPIGLAAPKL